MTTSWKADREFYTLGKTKFNSENWFIVVSFPSVIRVKGSQRIELSGFTRTQQKPQRKKKHQINPVCSCHVTASWPDSLWLENKVSGRKNSPGVGDGVGVCAPAAVKSAQSRTAARAKHTDELCMVVGRRREEGKGAEERCLSAAPRLEETARSDLRGVTLWRTNSRDAWLKTTYCAYKGFWFTAIWKQITPCFIL